MRNRLLTGFVLATIISPVTYPQGSHPPTNNPAKSVAITTNPTMNTLKIQITVNGKAITATLADNPTSRDFYTLLPLTLTLDDYATTEKIAYLPRKLSKDGAPAGIEPTIGDITYYAPWGNLAIFYRDFSYSDGLIKLGTINSGMEILTVPGSIKVKVERKDI
jgi:hypothetical protein